MGLAVKVIKAIGDAIVSIIRAVDCKCHSSCCESDCRNQRKNSVQEIEPVEPEPPQNIHDYAHQIGKIAIV